MCARMPSSIYQAKKSNVEIKDTFSHNLVYTTDDNGPSPVHLTGDAHFDP